MQEYIRKLIYKDLSKTTTEKVEKISFTTGLTYMVIYYCSRL